MVLMWSRFHIFGAPGRPLRENFRRPANQGGHTSADGHHREDPGRPSRMYEIDPRKWEEIVAASYDASGEFDEVTLTPRSGDRGRDVIAVKKGFDSVRLIESVKRYSPGTRVTAEEVQALLGVLLSDPQASKGIVSTTWEFAARMGENPQIMQYVPHRLELVNGTALVERLKRYTDSGHADR